MYADAGYSVPEVGQTDLDSVQYLVLGQYTSKPSYIILTELQFVHWHAGLLHETAACGEVEKLARLVYGQLFPIPTPSCH